MESVREEHFRQMLHENKEARARPAPSSAAPGAAARQVLIMRKVEPKKRDRRTIEEVQAVRWWCRCACLLVAVLSHTLCWLQDMRREKEMNKKQRLEKPG